MAKRTWRCGPLPMMPLHLRRQNGQKVIEVVEIMIVVIINNSWCICGCCRRNLLLSISLRRSLICLIRPVLRLRVLTSTANVSSRILRSLCVIQLGCSSLIVLTRALLILHNSVIYIRMVALNTIWLHQIELLCIHAFIK